MSDRNERVALVTGASSGIGRASALATLARTYGRLDHAFNNAGIEGEKAPTDQCTEQNWDRTIAVASFITGQAIAIDGGWVAQ